MQATVQQPRVISLRSKFVQSREQTRQFSDEMPAPIAKHKQNRDSLEFDRRESNRVSKIRKSGNVKIETSSSILAGNFAASLDQYRENIHDQAIKDIASTKTDLTAALDELALDVGNHFNQLIAIEEPLQRPFTGEILKIQTEKANEDDTVEEVLLQDRVSKFRKLREEKQKLLHQLWDEWEEIQMELISLTAEVCGSKVISLAQEQEENMKDGQLEVFHNAVKNGQELYVGTTIQAHGVHQDLQGFEECLNQITSETKQTVVEMQQQYNVQKSKLFKGLHRHIELLASL